MASRWKHDRPMSRAEMARRFPDDAACARHLFRKRWPNGFVCPACGGTKGWELAAKRFTWEFAGCGRQTSVTAGTAMHRSKLPLTLWFAAIHLLSKPFERDLCLAASGPARAAQLQDRLVAAAQAAACHGRSRSHRAGRSGRGDESELPYRTKEDPPAGGRGRSHIGKLLVIGAVELSDEGRPRRIRLDRLSDFTAASITGFIGRVVAPGATIVSDGLPSYLSLKEHKHHRKVVGSMAAHIVLPWVHRVFANLKRWGLGTFHGLRQAHLQRYLDEFVFRWNRRRHTRAAFDTLAGLTMRLAHASYRDFVDQRA
jgi:ISXO2-like transposase domain/Transposase zinc-ribbon domain